MHFACNTDQGSSVRKSAHHESSSRSGLRISEDEQEDSRLRPGIEDKCAVGIPLDERQRKLITLLLAGHTDVSAASRLGVSPRTVSNILRSLMDRLGVDNRFQLGVALGRRMRLPERPNCLPPRQLPG
ncbi:helix-turn-helix transcriptional regulator [Streptomyces shenzhenensis]|uniref:helix-turn-helix domain-containing protein n=1 Tax=Streptomyces shenzhenensis TaxID=943815 RepID=UPI00381E6507